MPQKYQITTPDGKVYEIEKPEAPAKGLGVGEAVVEGAKGVGAEALGQGKDLLALAQGGPNPVESYGGAVGEAVGRTIKELGKRAPGLITMIKAHPKALLTLSPENVVEEAFKAANPQAGQLDPSGMAQVLGHQSESTSRKVGRGLFLAAEALTPGALTKLSKVGAASKVAKLAEAAKAAEATGSAGELTAEVAGKRGLMTPSTSTPMEGPIKPPATRFTLGRPTVAPAAQMSGTGAGAVEVKPAGGFSLRPTGSAPLQMTDALVPDAGAANGAHKAEALVEAAGRTEPPGRAPVYGGTEKRSPGRVSGAAEDAAYNTVRKRIEEKNALARAKAMLITGVKKAEAPATPLMAEGDVPPAVVASAEPPKAVGATKGALEGFTKQPTKSLAQMVEQYGREGAAQRSAMSVDELDARLEAGHDPAQLAKLLRDRLGAEKAGRALGMAPEEVRKLSGGGASQLPTKAVEAIKAKAASEQAANGSVSPQTQALLDRIKSERERGSAPIKGLLVGGGAAAGGVAGSFAPSNNDEDRLGNTILGALGGGAAGLVGPKLVSGKGMSLLAKNALALRQAGFLSGGALVKHGLTGLGGAISSAVEAPGTTRGAALKEMLRMPTNVAEFGKSWKAGAIGPYGTDPDVLPALKIPNRLIGAAIDTQHKAMTRAGVPQADIDRYLLTHNNSLFGGMRNLDSNGMQVARTLVPFSRVPANIFTEGSNALGALGNKAAWKSGANALTLGATAGGAALQKWAGTDPKKIYIARLLLAGAGPRALPAIMGGLASGALSGNISARKTIGDISPIPEVESAKSLIGYKPAIITAMQRLGIIPQ